MAICRPKVIAAAPTSGRSAAEDGSGETFLAREEWANRGPRALARGVASPGEESRAAAIAAQAIEAQPSFGQIKPSRQYGSPVRRPRGEDLADIEWHAQEAWLTGRRKGNTRVQIGGQQQA